MELGVRASSLKLRTTHNHPNMPPTTDQPTTPNPQLLDTHNSLLTLSSNLQLYLTTSGSQRPNPSTPAVILLHGMGSSTTEWTPCIRQIARFARVHTYSRAGYQPSSPPPQPPTPSSSASDLRELLAAAKIAPPYLLVGHSYSGVLVRQCLADWPRGWIKGMLIVDSAPKRNAIPDSWPELLGDASYLHVVGHLLRRSRGHAQDL